MEIRTTLLNRQKAVDSGYVFPSRFRGHKTIQNNRASEATFRRAGVTDISSHNLRKTFATRLLSRGAAITDVQYVLGHASVKTTEKAYAAFLKNERFKQTINLLDEPVLPRIEDCEVVAASTLGAKPRFQSMHSPQFWHQSQP